MLLYSFTEPLEELLANRASFLCMNWTTVTLSAALQRSFLDGGLTASNLMKEKRLPLPEELQPASVGGEPHQASLCRLRLTSCHRLCISSQQLQLAHKNVERGDTLPPSVSGYKAPGWGAALRDLMLFLTLCTKRRQQNRSTSLGQRGTTCGSEETQGGYDTV